MNFKDLMDLPYSNDTRCIDFTALKSSLPNTPASVLEQLYVDHGRNSDFQDQYENLNISAIDWQLEEMPAIEIANSSFYQDFSSWYQSVMERAAQFTTKSWDCIDVRESVRAHWEKHATWEVSPVLFASSVYSIGAKYHLVEGHTRVALLKGLIQNNVVSKNSIHLVWVGRAKNL